MKNNKNKLELETLVFRVFLKHIKANKLYLAFRWSVNLERADRDLIHVLSSKLFEGKYRASRDRILRVGGSFIEARSIDDILKTLSCDRHEEKIENNIKFQMQLMNIVNTLIHSCIEHAITHDIHVLEKLGSDIFTEVGKKLFGEDFKDLTEEAIDPSQREVMAKMQELHRAFPHPEDPDFFRQMQKVLRNRMAERRLEREGVNINRSQNWADWSQVDSSWYLDDITDR